MSGIIQILDEHGFILGHVDPATGDQPARLVSIEAVEQGARLAAIIEAAKDLLSELDEHAQNLEPNPGQSAYMERLRRALAE